MQFKSTPFLYKYNYLLGEWLTSNGIIKKRHQRRRRSFFDDLLMSVASSLNGRINYTFIDI